MSKIIEIPFGAKDSENKGWEYTIPAGMEAVIEDGKVIVREKEGEDERIRKWLIEMVEEFRKANSTNAEHNGNCSEAIAYLERQKPLSTEETELNSLAFLEQLGYACIPPGKEQEWSEEDDQLIGFIFDLLNNLVWRKDLAMSKEECLERLKSLRPHPHWKPSEEQIKALQMVKDSHCFMYQKDRVAIEKLLEQIKSL